MPETPDLGSLLAATVAFTRGSIATAIPATVLAYNPTLQTVTAKPTISGRRHDVETDALVPFPLPAVANVPVIFPRGGGAGLTLPVTVGDTGILLICDRSLDEWKSTGAAENVPLDTRRHDLTDAVFFPGGHPFVSPIPPSGYAAGSVVLEALSLLLGSSAATAPVALQPALLVELGRISAAITALGGVYTPGLAPAPVPPADPTLCASTKVRAE